MNDELKPCPCTGVSADIEFKAVGSNFYYYRVYCDKSWVCTDLFPSKVQAIEAWNNRPVEDELRQKLEVAKQALAYVKERYERNDGVYGYKKDTYQKAVEALNGIEK